MAAASSGLERREPELHDAAKNSEKVSFNLKAGGDGIAGLGGAASGDGGTRVKQQATEFMILR
jgi:hypothetical protein